MVGAGYEVGHIAWEPGRAHSEDRPRLAQVQTFGDSTSSMSWLGKVRALRRAADAFEPDVVHAGTVQGAAFGAAVLGLRPLVTMSWGFDLLWGARRGPSNWMARFSLARTSVFVGDCQTVRRAAVRLGMAPDRIVIFPWGVDLKAFAPGPKGAWRTAKGWQDQFLVLCTRSLEKIYGTDLLVSAFLAALAQDDDLRLVLVGQGSLERSLRRSVEGAGAGDRVHFAGHVPYAGLPAWYRSADLFVSPSRSDGTSVSLLEALATGLPALVSDIPSNREWVTPGQNGEWFVDGDRGSLTSALLQAKRSAPLVEMGHRSREVAEARAEWGANFAVLQRAYVMALDRRGGTP